MSDLIRRTDAIKAVESMPYDSFEIEDDREWLITLIANISTIEPKRGKWEEEETFHNGDDNPIIEEWQSARCSVCGKYHTTPYMYYFDNYNFCPNCGADMRGADNENV